MLTMNQNTPISKPDMMHHIENNFKDFVVNITCFLLLSSDRKIITQVTVHRNDTIMLVIHCDGDCLISEACEDMIGG